MGKMPVHIDTIHDHDHVWYRSATHKIVLPPVRYFFNPDCMFISEPKIRI